MCKGEDREIILNLAELVPGFLILLYSLESKVFKFDFLAKISLESFITSKGVS
jgi:hypothetical protein